MNSAGAFAACMICSSSFVKATRESIRFPPACRATLKQPLPKAPPWCGWSLRQRSEEHTSELQSRGHLVCRLLLEKKNNGLGVAIEQPHELLWCRGRALGR